MARVGTTSRVHAAVLSLVRDVGYRHLTMEGIAAQAGVSKQTIYRTWPSTSAALFSALLDQSTTDGQDVDVPNTGDLATDLETLLVATLEEMTDPATEPLLRAVAAEIQTSEPVAAELGARLLTPQLQGVEERMARAGISDAQECVELLYGAVFHRWLLRTQPFTPDWIRGHVARTLHAVAQQGKAG